MPKVEQEVGQRSTVIFLSREHANTTFLVKRYAKVVSRNAEGVAHIELTGDDKVAVFRDGICSTSDPEVIKFLESEPDVWRGDDPLANLKLAYGANEIEAVAAALRAQPAQEE